VEQAHGERVAIAEFPTTGEAADVAHELGLKVLMGAPNLLRGASHSGNIAAGDLAGEGRLDILSSDYYPASLLMAGFRLAEPDYGLPLPTAIATVTATPATAVGLGDRGRLAPGLRADLVRVHLAEGTPIVRGVWRAGARVG
jgi:alpha-D-ribose 1-methylphosphonate 5-triphosphate diphosphatase